MAMMNPCPIELLSTRGNRSLLPEQERKRRSKCLYDLAHVILCERQ